MKDLSHYLRHIKFRLLKILRVKHVESHYGVTLQANWEDATFMFCITGAYGETLSKYLRDYQGDFIFLDIGANQGLYSLLAAKNSNCIKAIAFEPVMKTFHLLTQNILRNDFSDKIEAVNMGVSSADAEVEIAIEINHSGAATLRKNDKTVGGIIEKIRVINHVEIDKKIPTHIDLVVKVDVEGHESVVLNEMLKSKYSASIQSIFYEIDENWTDATAIEQVLRAAGFRSFNKVGVGSHYDILALR
ncbi:MAG: FkbM family methyltransferase [Cognaticolwellia sp.]|jgi:FkbM family methyltransferase